MFNFSYLERYVFDMVSLTSVKLGSVPFMFLIALGYELTMRIKIISYFLEHYWHVEHIKQEHET